MYNNFILYFSGTIAPPERGLISVNQYFPWIPEWVDLNVWVPVAATVVVLLVGMIVICVAISRRSRGPEQTRLRGTPLMREGRRTLFHFFKNDYE